MGKIKLAVILSLCLGLFVFVTGKVSAFSLDIEKGGAYHMITSPVLPEDPDPQTSLKGDLGRYNRERWRFFRYGYRDPDDDDTPEKCGGSRYFELKTQCWNPPEHDFDFGRGYWIISQNPVKIDIEGAPVGERNWIILDHRGNGWNQIGNIYLQDFSVGMFPNCNLWVLPRSGGTWYQLNDPNNNYTYKTLQGYIPGKNYIDIGDEDGEVLKAGKGYWLKTTWTEDVYLIFDPAGLTPPSSTNSTNLTDQDFLEIVAQQEDPPDPPPAMESAFSVIGDSGGGGGGCFIATAAYGDYDDPGVQLLRGFRDRYLLKNRLGRFFTDTYYRYSPSLASLVVKHKLMGTLVRFNLMPVIGISAVVSKMNAYVFLVFMAFPFLGSIFFLKRRKGAWGRCKPKLSRDLKERRKEK